MENDLKTSFIVTNQGIYYKLLYCDKLTMGVFDKSSTESVCTYCKEHYPENNCITDNECKTKVIEQHPNGLYSIYLRFIKPWIKR